MLLNRHRLDPTDDRGSAMAAVIGLLALTVIVTAAIAGASIASLTTTSTTRASVQAQAAADGGVDAVYAGLRAGSCSAETSAAEAPSYSAKVYARSSTTAAWPSNPVCPNGSTVQVRIVTTGYADGATPTRPGTVTRGGEAVYTWTPATSASTAGGPAVYAFDAAGFAGSGKLVSGGTSPDVMVKQGNVNCSGGAAMQGDFIVDGGTLTLDGSCGVTGNVWASGAITLTGNVPVGGNVVGPSLLNTGGQVGGSTWTAGETRVQWGSSIAGDVTAQTLTIAGGKIGGRAWSVGDTRWDGGGLKIDGSLVTRSESGGSSIGTAAKGKTIVPAGPGAGPAAPQKPVVPDWIDFASTSSDWSGYTVRTLTGACGYDQVNAAIQSLGAAKGLIDGRGCTSALSLGSYQKATLSNDLVIVAKSYNLDGSAGFVSAGNAARKLWLVTPDDLADRKPTCASGSSFQIGGAFSFGTGIATMMYSPCRVVLASGLKVAGQVFAGQAGIAGGATLTYAPIGLPGFDLETGTPTTSTGSGGSIGALVSRREVVAG